MDSLQENRVDSMGKWMENGWFPVSRFSQHQSIDSSSCPFESIIMSQLWSANPGSSRLQETYDRASRRELKLTGRNNKKGLKHSTTKLPFVVAQIEKKYIRFLVVYILLDVVPNPDTPRNPMWQ